MRRLAILLALVLFAVGCGPSDIENRITANHGRVRVCKIIGSDSYTYGRVIVEWCETGERQILNLPSMNCPLEGEIWLVTYNSSRDTATFYRKEQ